MRRIPAGVSTSSSPESDRPQATPRQGAAFIGREGVTSDLDDADAAADQRIDGAHFVDYLAQLARENTGHQALEAEQDVDEQWFEFEP